MAMERRDFPRIESEASSEIVASDGSLYPTLALDISLTGLQLLCDRPTAERVAPKLLGTSPADKTEIVVRIRVYLKDRTKLRVQTRCRIMSVRSIGDDEFRIGLKYLDFHNDGYSHIERYVDEWLT